MTPLTIRIDDASTVSALLDQPENARALYVFAHGAGAGMTHAFMAGVASGFAARGIATLRYQFPYMERASKRPDPAALAHAAVRAAVAEAARAMPDVPLFAGGKSFGGRMTSQAQAAAALPGVRGLVFFGFPLHPADKPGTERANHLLQVKLPMLFLQGTRDTLAEPALVQRVVDSLGDRATLHAVDGADHSFHVPARSGTNDREVMDKLLDTAAEWMSARLS
jgi:predicted alpha/beta-hydrolase family hydrolase